MIGDEDYEVIGKTEDVGWRGIEVFFSLGNFFNEGKSEWGKYRCFYIGVFSIFFVILI